MANIEEYLSWRADVPFAMDPFHDVDNLVLAQLSYTDFDGLVPEAGEVPLRDVCRKYWEIHTEEEILARNTFTERAPLLMRPMVEEARYRDVMVGNYFNVISQSAEEQVSGVTFRLPDGSLYVAYRGTDNTIVGWKEDFNLSYMARTPGQNRAIAYLNWVLKEETASVIRVGGHSKGGNFAVCAATFCEPELQQKISVVYSNDGPGFREKVIRDPRYQAILPRICSIVPEESLIGMLLSNPEGATVVKSSASGLMQHDAMTWQVQRRSFVTVPERSEISKFMERTVSSWLEQISDEERAEFVDTLFSSIEASGADTLNDLGENRMRSAGRIIKALATMPKDKQQQFQETISTLMKSGKDTLLSELKSGGGRLLERAKGAVAGDEESQIKLPDLKNEE